MPEETKVDVVNPDEETTVEVAPEVEEGEEVAAE